MSSGPRPTSVPSGILSGPCSCFAAIDMGRKLGAPPPFCGGAGSPSNTQSLGLRPTSIPSGILMHPAVWPQQKSAENWEGGSAPFLWKGLRPHLTPSRLAEAYLRVKCRLVPFSRLATINMGRKFGGPPLFGGGAAGSPSNTKLPGPRRLPPYQVAS